MRMRTLGWFVLGLLVLAACGTEGGDDTTTVATDEPVVTTTADAGQEEETTTTAEPEEEMTTTTGAEMMDGVHASDTDLGSILVDPEGFTLYVFTVDTGGESSCYDDCESAWPPVPADTEIGSDLDPAMFGATTRTDGTEQLTVNGMPLYRFAADASPGDTSGQGANDVWFVVDADGNMIEAAADAFVIDYDYDY